MLLLITNFYSIGSEIFIDDAEFSSKSKDLEILKNLVIRKNFSKDDLKNAIKDEKLIFEIDFNKDTLDLNSQTLIFKNGKIVKILDRFYK